jgi:hypothetical protein
MELSTGPRQEEHVQQTEFEGGFDSCKYLKFKRFFGLRTVLRVLHSHSHYLFKKETQIKIGGWEHA